MASRGLSVGKNTKCATNHVLPSTKGGRNSDLGHVRADGIT